MTLVRHLVTGGVSQFLEEHIAEGDELKGGLDAEQTADTRSRCKIIQMSLFDGPLSQYGVSSFFKNPWQGLSHTTGPKPNTILSNIPASTQLYVKRAKCEKISSSRSLKRREEEFLRQVSGATFCTCSPFVIQIKTHIQS